jgi:hypothetical protein
MTPVLLVAAHQGEEFVLILPAMLLAGAFFIMRWANQPVTNEKPEPGAPARDEESASDDELIEAAKAVNGRSLAAVGQVAIEPEDESHPGDDPDHHDRQGGGVAERLTK